MYCVIRKYFSGDFPPVDFPLAQMPNDAHSQGLRMAGHESAISDQIMIR